MAYGEKNGASVGEIVRKNKNDKWEKQQLLYKMLFASAIFTLLNLISYELSSKLLNFVSLIPAAYIVISFFQYTIE